MSEIQTLAKNVLSEFDRKKDAVVKKSKFLLLVGGVGLVILFGTLSSFLVSAAIGGLAVVALAAGTIAAVFSYDAYMAKWKNKRLEMLLEEAKKNPIYTAVNIYLERDQRLVENKAKLLEVIAASETYERTVEEHERKFPEDPALAKMKSDMKLDKANIERLKANRAKAKGAQEKLKYTIELMQSQYEAAKARLAANKSMGNIETEFENIMLAASYRSVLEQTSQSFAELELERVDSGSSAALPAPNDETFIVDVTPTKVGVVR